MLIRMPSKLTIMLVTVFLVGCDSGNSPTTSRRPVLNIPVPVSPNNTNPSNDPVSTGVPNFAISNFIGTGVYVDKFNWIATVTNTGTGPGDLPRGGLLLESLTADFSTGSAKSFHSVRRNDGLSERLLMPGESAEITGSNTILNYGFLEGRFNWTDTYVKFWINPDYGTAAFDNPVDGSNKYETKYRVAELSYEDNISDTIVVERQRYADARNCIETDIEENDTLDTAQAIELGQTYEAILCEDSADIFFLNLEANAFYEVIPGGFDFESGIINRLLIIAPDGSYVVDKTGIGTLFKSTAAGKYYVVVTVPFGEDHSADDGTFRIVKK